MAAVLLRDPEGVSTADHHRVTLLLHVHGLIFRKIWLMARKRREDEEEEGEAELTAVHQQLQDGEGNPNRSSAVTSEGTGPFQLPSALTLVFSPALSP